MSIVMGFLVGGGIVWWILRGRESTGAIVQNALVALVCGGLGVTLLTSGSGGGAVWAGLAFLGYAGWGVYRTLPWIRERLDRDGD